MASCAHPNNRDNHSLMHHDESDGTDNEAQTPVQKKNKGKRKELEEGNCASKTQKKTRSWVWDHFMRQKEDVDKANCNYCGKEMTYPAHQT